MTKRHSGLSAEKSSRAEKESRDTKHDRARKDKEEKPITAKDDKPASKDSHQSSKLDTVVTTGKDATDRSDIDTREGNKDDRRRESDANGGQDEAPSKMSQEASVEEDHINGSNPLPLPPPPQRVQGSSEANKVEEGPETEKEKPKKEKKPKDSKKHKKEKKEKKDSKKAKIDKIKEPLGLDSSP